MVREAERKRLVELLSQFERTCPENCTGLEKSCTQCVLEQKADHLLDNGIVVLPCKIGEKLYDASEYAYEIPYPEIYEVESDRMTIEKAENGDYLFTYEDAYIRHEEMGEVIFTSREEALKSLKGAEV